MLWAKLQVVPFAHDRPTLLYLSPQSFHLEPKTDDTVAPANVALRYDRRRLEDWENNLYSGPPSKEQAAAWDDLLYRKSLYDPQQTSF